MRVYELIQELSRYSADTEVKFHVNAKYSADIEVEFDRENEDNTQEVTADVEFDDDVEIEEIDDRENKVFRDIVINLKY